MINYPQYYARAMVAEHQGNPTKPSCSQLPSLEKCRMYVGESGTSEAAINGTCLHLILDENLDLLLKGMSRPNHFPIEEWEKLDMIVERLEMILEDGWRVHSKEEYFENDHLTGSIDLILKRNHETMLVDYKSGRTIITPDSAQLAGYGTLAIEDNGEFLGHIIQPYNGCVPQPYDEGEAAARVAHILEAPKVETPGDVCKYCAKFKSCSALHKAVVKTEAFNLENVQDVERILDLAPAIEKIIKTAKATAQTMSLSRYKVVETTRKSVGDVEGFLNHIGGDIPAEAVTLKMGELKKAGIEVPAQFIKASVSKSVRKK